MGSVVLIAMILIFVAAAYFGNSWYGTPGLSGVVGLFAAVFIALWILGGLQFG